MFVEVVQVVLQISRLPCHARRKTSSLVERYLCSSLLQLRFRVRGSPVNHGAGILIVHRFFITSGTTESMAADKALLKCQWDYPQSPYSEWGNLSATDVVVAGVFR